MQYSSSVQALGRVFSIGAALFLLIGLGAPAQEAPERGGRRLTPEQYMKVNQTNWSNLRKAFQLSQEGKPAQAIPIVSEVILLEREVLKEAESNPLAVSRPRSPDPLVKGLPATPTDPGTPDGVVRQVTGLPTVQELEREILCSLSTPATTSRNAR